jgi:hypothetical protein
MLFAVKNPPGYSLWVGSAFLERCLPRFAHPHTHTALQRQQRQRVEFELGIIVIVEIFCTAASRASIKQVGLIAV